MRTALATVLLVAVRADFTAKSSTNQQVQSRNGQPGCAAWCHWDWRGNCRKKGQMEACAECPECIAMNVPAAPPAPPEHPLSLLPAYYFPVLYFEATGGRLYCNDAVFTLAGMTWCGSSPHQPRSPCLLTPDSTHLAGTGVGWRPGWTTLRAD